MRISIVSKSIFIIALIINAIIFFRLISVYFGNNPLNNSQLSYTNYISFFPEGWAFFTKSPKEPRLYIYDCNKKNIENLNLRNFSKDYYFGISRHNRILNIEVENIMSNVQKDSIKSFSLNSTNERNISKILNLNSIAFSNIKIDKNQNSHFIGKYIIAVQYLLPWSLLHRQPDYPSKYIIYPINIIPK